MKFSTPLQKVTKKPDILKVYELLCESSRLKRSGRATITLCPLHGDRKPSFAMYEDNDTFYCFSCAEKGDSFDLIQKILGTDFAGAKAWAQDNYLL